MESHVGRCMSEEGVCWFLFDAIPPQVLSAVGLGGAPPRNSYTFLGGQAARDAMHGRGRRPGAQCQSRNAHTQPCTHSPMRPTLSSRKSRVRTGLEGWLNIRLFS